MKKGIIYILIIVLLITNIALTAILVFAIVPANNATSSLVGKIAEAIDLQKVIDEDDDVIGIDDMESYIFENKITVNLKTGIDNKTHYVQIKLVLTLNKADESYSRYKGKIADNEELIKSIVIDTLSEYTYDNVSAKKTEVTAEICARLRNFFNSTKFINSVSFSEFIIS